MAFIVIHLPHHLRKERMSTTLTSEQITLLGALKVYDEDGGTVKVSSLFEGEGKTTVVFIRFVPLFAFPSFFDPNPFPSYLSIGTYIALSTRYQTLPLTREREREAERSERARAHNSVPPSLLLPSLSSLQQNYITSLSTTLSPSSNLLIIGCGSWELIKFYRSTPSPSPTNSNQTHLFRLELTSSFRFLTPRGNLLPLQDLRRPHSTNLPSSPNATQPPSLDAAVHQRDPSAQVLEGRRNVEARGKERWDGLEEAWFGLEGGCL